MIFSPKPKEFREDFFDREKELESLNRFLGADAPLCLILGLRRTGKSSLLRVGLRESGIPSLILDLRRFEERVKVSYSDLVRALNEQFNKLVSSRGRLSRRLLEGLKSVTGVEVSGLRVYFKWGGRERLLLSGLLDRINDVAEELGVRFVLAFDEAQELIMVRGVRLDYLLAYAYDNLRSIKIILTGSKVGLLYRFLRFNDPNAPLFGRLAWTIELSYFSRELSLAFLEAGFREASLHYKKEEAERVVDVLNGVPGWLNYYGYLRVQGLDHERALHEAKRRAVSLLASELKNFLALRPYAADRYVSILDALSSGAKRWSGIKRAAEARLGEAIPPKNFTELLGKLVESGFVVKKHEEYELADPLLGEAVKRLK